VQFKGEKWSFEKAETAGVGAGQMTWILRLKIQDLL
jgi:hypothetical protein